MFQAPIKKELFCDVLVVGGGVAGFSAAVAAARAGASVFLTEDNGYLGGVATAGLVAPFMTCYDTKGEKQIVRGIFGEVVDRLVEIGGAIPPAECRCGNSFSGYRPRGHLGTTPFSKEALKLVMDRMCTEAGVEVRYHFLFVGAETSEDGKAVTAAIFATKNGFYRIRAKAFIDCTGDAALCDAAGAECVISDESGELQPVSTFILIDGVDREAMDKVVFEGKTDAERYFMNEIAKGREEGRFPCHTKKVRIFEQPNGIWAVNMCQIDEQIDVLDPEAISRAEAEGREQAAAMVAFLRENVPPMKNIRMLETSAQAGVRESRRMVGEYVVTGEDLLASRRFEDTVAVLCNSVDIHTGGDNGVVNYTPFANPEPYTIPYRALVSKDLTNLWTAGKTFSSDRRAQGAARVIPPSMAMGQAAGCAAAITVKQNIAARDVDYNELKTLLLAQGAYLGD